MFWKLRNLGSDYEHLYFDTEGYVANAIARAHVASWGTTFFLLIALAAYGDRFPQLPAVFFLQLTLAVMSAVVAGTVLVLTRADDEEPEGAGVA